MGIFNVFKVFDIQYLGKKVLGSANVKDTLDKAVPYLKEQFKNFIEECHIAREKLKDIPGTNYALGLKHMKKGNISDAILRFRMVSFLRPEHIGAHYNLGRCLLLVGENDNAKKQFETAIELDKNFDDARYQLAKLQGPESIKNIPLSIVKERTEAIAEAYDAGYYQDIGGQKAMISVVLGNIEDKNPNLEVLDLGCGYGIGGQILKEKEVVKRMVGVDISASMAAKAAALKFSGNKVYDLVVEKEIHSYLAASNDKFDLCLADMSFEYFGDLSEIASLLRKSLKTSGILAFLAITNDKAEYKLNIEYDTFSHSKKYINEQLVKVGFTEVQTKDFEIDAETPAVIFVYKLT